MRRSTLTFVIITAGVGLGLFHLKYQVMTLEKHYRHIRHTIGHTHEAIHILKAEWAHLNDPLSLQRLCAQYLETAPIKGSQLVSLQEVKEEKQEEMPGYDQGGLDQLVAALVADHPPLADIHE